MYNEQNKIEYLESKGYGDRVYESQVGLFNSIELEEQIQGTDICNIKPQTYPDIIMKYNSVTKVAYLRRLYNMLMAYRSWCFDNSKIDPIVFFANLDSDLNFHGNRMSLDEIMKIFQTYQHSRNEELYTFDNLVDLLDEVFQFQENIEGRKHIDTLAWRIYCASTKLYAIFLYAGIPKDDIAMIKKNDIVFLKEDGIATAVVVCEGKPYKISGKAVQMLWEFPNMYKGSNAERDFSNILSDTYLLGKSVDDTENKIRKRSNSLCFKLRRQLVLYGNYSGDKINVKTIESRGQTYRMAKIALKYPIPCDSNEDIKKLYSTVTGDVTVSKMAFKGIRNNFIEQYEYMKNKEEEQKKQKKERSGK